LLILVLGNSPKQVLELCLCHFTPQLTRPGHHYKSRLYIVCAAGFDEANACKPLGSFRFKYLGEDVGASFGLSISGDMLEIAATADGRHTVGLVAVRRFLGQSWTAV
jgi:hypothetical protein